MERKALLAMAAVFAACAARAADPVALTEPFPTSNRNPLVQAHGIPGAKGARLLATGATALELQAEAANSFTASHSGVEDIELDGESWRVGLNWRTGFGERFELGLAIPWISHRGGELDGLIDDWHTLWNLPDGNRDSQPRDRLRYHYRRDGKTLLELDAGEEGMGDASLQFAYQLAADDRQWLALRTHVSLPTGDAEQLTGSGGSSVGAALHASRQGLFGSPRWTVHGSLGALWLADPEILDPVAEDVAAHASATVAWSASQRLSFKLQIDGHTPLYDSALTEMGDPAWQLVFGGALSLRSGLVLDAWLSEDIAVDTGPDVVFGLGLRYRP